jgi:hypothetical protein
MFRSQGRVDSPGVARLNTMATERVVASSEAADVCSEDALFESRPGHSLSLQV